MQLTVLVHGSEVILRFGQSILDAVAFCCLEQIAMRKLCFNFKTFIKATRTAKVLYYRTYLLKFLIKMDVTVYWFFLKEPRLKSSTSKF